MCGGSIRVIEQRERVGCHDRHAFAFMQQPTLALCIPDSPCVVPLRDWSAAALLEIVSSSERDEKLQSLHHLLTVDPAFLLWAAVSRDQVRTWRDVTVDALANWLSDRVGDLLLEHETTLHAPQTRNARLHAAQITTVCVARRATTSLNGSAAEIGSIVYAGSLLAFARDWLMLPNGDFACSPDLPEWLPGWLQLLLTETQSTRPPSIEFMKPIQSSIRSGEFNQHTLVGEVERQQWSVDFPIVRSLFAKNLRYLGRLKDQKASETTRVETEKLAAMKELAYGASHEINNPLANISTRAQLLMRDEADADRKRQLATITRQAYRAHEMISDLMLFAKPPKLEKLRFKVSDFFDGLSSCFDEDPEINSADIRIHIEDDVELHADEQQLTAALQAIIKNSVEASDAKCSIEIDCRVGESPAFSVEPQQGQFAEIRISDNGSGITPDVRRHLFDPFYSGREAGRGLGFGLSKAWRIIEQHGGQIVVDSPSGGGTTMSIRLPLG